MKRKAIDAKREARNVKQHKRETIQTTMGGDGLKLYFAMDYER
ncbi:MAG TPA: hypothetical protein VHB48_04105 [Chitinophagaceae bacterium]|nr:hypothetical protein [Chitinophagaceae bacterium]